MLNLLCFFALQNDNSPDGSNYSQIFANLTNKKRQLKRVVFFYGSPGRIWTYDPSVNSRMLLPLSYWGIEKCGDVLPSHDVSVTLLSALQGLTSVFGMRTGGSPAIWSPQWLNVYSCLYLVWTYTHNWITKLKTSNTFSYVLYCKLLHIGLNQ